MGHEVHTPDLPGHGDHPDDIQSLTLKRYVAHIGKVVEAQHEPVILVGHSMGGMIISQVAQQMPERIRRLVYLCAYLPRSGQSLFDLIEANRNDDKPAPIESAMTLSADKRRCQISPALIEPLFYNRCTGDQQKHVPETFPDQAVLPLSGKVTLSEDSYGKVAKTYICCSDDKVIPVAHQRRMLKLQPCDEMIQLDADHSPFLSCTGTLASVLHSISLAQH